MKIRLIISFALFSFLAFSQNNKEIDSILLTAKSQNIDSLKLSIYNQAGFSYIFSDAKELGKLLIADLKWH